MSRERRLWVDSSRSAEPLTCACCGGDSGIRQIDAELCKALHQIVGTVVMVFGAAKLFIAVAITRCEQGVVNTAGGVLQHGQNRSAMVITRMTVSGAPPPRLLMIDSATSR
jgi:hypothetical protein